MYNIIYYLHYSFSCNPVEKTIYDADNLLPECNNLVIMERNDVSYTAYTAYAQLSRELLSSSSVHISAQFRQTRR